MNELFRVLGAKAGSDGRRSPKHRISVCSLVVKINAYRHYDTEREHLQSIVIVS